MALLKIPVCIGGSRGRAWCPTEPNSLFLHTFSPKSTHVGCPRPPNGSTPPMGNSGSATGLYLEMKIWFVINILEHLMKNTIILLQILSLKLLLAVTISKLLFQKIMLAEGARDEGKIAEILLSREEYHTRLSTVELLFHAKDEKNEERWKPFRNSNLKRVRIWIHVS